MSADPDTAGPLGSARAAMRRNPLGLDVALVAVLALLGSLSEIVLVAPSMTGPRTAPEPLWIVLWAVAFCLPLLLRRRFPSTVLLVTTAHFPFFWAAGQGNEIMSWLVLGVGAYSAAAYGRRRPALWAGAAAFLVTTSYVVIPLVLGLLSAAPAAVLMVNNLVPYLVGGSLGVMTRRLRAFRAELEQRNAELARERRVNEQRAVLEERVRIARELHDVVAHHVVLMGIQAGVAQRLFDDRPDDARAAVADVQAGSGRAVAELQRAIGVLRSGPAAPAGDTAAKAAGDTARTAAGNGDAPSVTEPAPGLDRLPALVEQVRRAGLPVELTLDPGEVDAGLGLSAYRIVQEALTNTLKHAGPASARVRVRCGAGVVEVEVVDDGCATPGDGDGGRGLVGARERVALHGGRLDAGPLATGGFRVRAVLGP
ncbi:sensor histidine kinase [Pseudonocardia sp. KRD291]|uniref:sensor histidine kinase n=1 Tax=Pseudonocardia sp. KRD291 TaxID=2792007 RepID=UPI001C4A6DE2|nr:histidine kinase [Pseudonocardia sp. KRD291]MBW0105100.1 sensor histidine kinase [Pseudonocardia sp. KRD291]